MGGRGVEDFRRARAKLAGERHRFLRRVVGQAQDHEIDAGHEVALGARVLALVGVDADDLDVGARRQQLADQKTRRARLAIDENFAVICAAMSQTPGRKRSAPCS